MCEMKYSIGEKVCFYDRGERYIGIITGFEYNCYKVDRKLLSLPVHEKQMRKIKPKKKAREFWIKKNNIVITQPSIIGNFTCYAEKEVLTEKPENAEDYIHVKEVLK